MAEMVNEVLLTFKLGGVHQGSLAPFRPYRLRGPVRSFVLPQTDYNAAA